MPFNRSLYPDNWEEIALQIKNEVSWKCEGCGRACRRPGESDADLIERIQLTRSPHFHELLNEVESFDGQTSVDLKLGRWTLTVAHMDHRPENCDRSNLKALCSVCHCRYDLSQMARKKMLKRERLGQIALPLAGDD